MSWIDKEYALAKLEAVLSQYIAEMENERADAITEAYHIVEGMEPVSLYIDLGDKRIPVKSSFSNN